MSEKSGKVDPRSKANAVHEEIVAESGPLFLIFGGMAKRKMMPPFEFQKISRCLDSNRIFFRDPNQCWYHAGLPGIGNSIDGVASFIKTRIQQINPSRVVFMGNSMGGYASILFSAILNLGDVIAFAPQTYLSPTKRFQQGDKRWSRAIFRTYAKSLFRRQAKFFDLRNVLNHSPVNARSIQIYVSSDCRLDASHCTNVADFPEVEIHDANQGGHDVIQRLRESGELRSILLKNRAD